MLLQFQNVMESLTDQDVNDMVSEAITVLSNETTEHEDVQDAANYFIDWSRVLHQREDLVKELVKGNKTNFFQGKKRDYFRE